MNPRNSATIIGRIGKGGIRYLTSDGGKPFGCLFTVLVSRGYRSKKTGRYEIDPVTVKYVFKNESVRQFAQRLEIGDGVVVAGTVRVENEKMLLYTEDVSYDDLTLERKYPVSTEEEKSAYAVPQKPLPF